MELIVDNVHSAQTYVNNMEHSTVASTLDFLDLLQHQLGQSEDFFMLLNIMQGMSSPGVDINRSIAQIVRLLQPFPDLLEGFNGFLPKVYSLPFPCAKQSASPQPTLPFTHSSSLSSSLHAPMDFIQHSPDRSSLIYSSSPPTLSRACSPEPTSSSLKMTKQENASNDIAGCLISAFSVLEPSKAGTSSSSSTPSAPDDYTCLTSGMDSQIGQQACSTSPAGNRTPPQLSPEASPTSTVSTGTLPLCVEREHAMQFIEEIEATYHDRPELYRSFLNLLRTYQLKHMGIEGEVLKEADEETFCQELVNLFSQDHNLLNTFMSLLPSTLRGQLDSKVHICSYNKNYKRTLDKTQSEAVAVGENLDLPPLKKNKRLSSFRDASLAAAGQYGTLRELSFFDKVRRALRSQEVYENLLRCIHLYNIDIISVSDLLDLIKPFLGKFPELLIQFKHLLGKCFGMSTQRDSLQDRVENIEMDLSSCKRLGPSYRALPESYQQPKCSGRTALCREVLNDIWVSFPSWSEDSTFVSSKKTQYEEHIYRCEDERFELDVVLETNLATIRVLENVQKKLSRLSPEEQSHLHLDDCLGGTSEVINCKALQRIYGDKAAEVIAGLKQNPANSIPVVLKRLKAREEEWREAQKGFNKLWREQNDRFYLRSLDPCGLTFRQLDTKALRSKSLLNQIEEAFDERQELMTTGQVQAFSSPHISLDYPDHTLHTDATALLLHDLGSHTGPATAELQHTRDLLFVFLPMLLFAPQLHPEDFVLDKSSGNEDESVSEEKEDHSLGSPCEQKNAIQKTFAQACNPGAADSVYSLFFANSTWYIFLRLHQILCTRLLYIREHAPESVPAKNQASPAQGGNPQAETAISPADTTEEKVASEPEKEAKGGSGYEAFLALTRRLLDGEMEPSEYEDALRDLLTIHGFVAYTMDRLVHHACRQLQQLVCDEACISLVKLHREARARGAGGGLCVSHAVRAPLEACYHRQAEQIVADDNCFKVMFIQSGEHVVMTMELLDSEEESTEDTFEIENWSNYVEHYTNSEDVGVEIHLSQKPIFLRRNLQRQQTMENMIAQWYRSKQHKSKLKVVEDLEYRFRFNSFQLQFVANSEDYFYRRGSLHRARQHRFGAKRLQAWHCWLAERARKGGLLKEQDRATRMWFMGLNQESSTIMAVCLQIMANGRSVNVYRSVMCTSRLPDSP